jgi:uncharacterized protein (DUF433 family)
MNATREKRRLVNDTWNRARSWDEQGEQPSNATVPPFGAEGIEALRVFTNGKRLEALEGQVRILSAKVEEMERRSALFPSIVRTPDVCGGSPRLIRTRIPIWVLQQMRQLGFSDPKILESYPTLTEGDLAQAWGYVAAHKEQIDKEIEENERY